MVRGVRSSVCRIEQDRGYVGDGRLSARHDELRLTFADAASQDWQTVKSLAAMLCMLVPVIFKNKL